MEREHNLSETFGKEAHEPPLSKQERRRIQALEIERRRETERTLFEQRRNYDGDLAKARAEVAREHNRLTLTLNGTRPPTKQEIEFKAKSLVLSRNAEQLAVIGRAHEVRVEAVKDLARRKHGLDQKTQTREERQKSSEIRREFREATHGFKR